MTAKARQALNQIEDAENAAPKVARTFEQAVAYAVEKGYRWMIWGGTYYTISNGQASKA